MKALPLTAIRLDGGTQSRVALQDDVIADYALAVSADVVIPPVTVFFDGQDHWLADGFHRYRAHEAAGKPAIAADVRTGSKRDAQLHSFGANASHGLRRTNEDKRNAVASMLADAEWRTWSDNLIAKHCAVSHPFVGAIRKSLVTITSDQAVDKRTYVNKNGITTEMSVAAIGKGLRPVDSARHASDHAISVANVCTAAPELNTPAVASRGITTELPTPPSATIATDQTAADAKGANVSTPPTADPAADHKVQIEFEAHGDTDLASLVDEQVKDIEALQAQVKAAMADDAKAEAMRWQRMAQIATQRQNELMDRVNERERELKRHVNTLRRTAKILGEVNLNKIPSAAEQLMTRVLALESSLKAYTDRVDGGRNLGTLGNVAHDKPVPLANGSPEPATTVSLPSPAPSQEPSTSADTHNSGEWDFPTRLGDAPPDHHATIKARAVLHQKFAADIDTDDMEVL